VSFSGVNESFGLVTAKKARFVGSARMAADEKPPRSPP